MRKHCCSDMEDILQIPEAEVKYLSQFREYILESRVDKPICLALNYCPWCGSRLPSSLRDIFFDTLEKECNLNLDILHLYQAPDEFQSDQWWKKRKL